MKWFDGAIPTAIQTAKSTNKVFVVYITGEDDMSKQMDNTWEEKAVTDLCEEEAVAVKIKANSPDCNFFSQIYPVVVVPSTFFIGTNGTPLEVTGGYVAAEDFVDKVKSVVEIHKSKPAPAAVPQQSTASAPDTAASTSANSEAAESDSKKPKLDHDTKVEKAKELLDEKRAEKMRKAEEEAKQKEVDRVRLGREMQKLKQYQQEREMKETQDQIKKDREEDRKARERVKEQIARDRAERAARFNKEIADREKTQEEAKRTKLLAQQQAAVEAEARRSESARLQFRLPDGSSAAQTFPSGETLHQAYNFASQMVGGSVTMSTSFPRRTYTDADMNKTFIDLQLAPSSVILVAPGQRALSQASGGGGSAVSSSGILGLIFAPFVFLMNILRSLFSSFSSSPRPPTSSSSPSQGEASSASGGDRYVGAQQRRPQGGQGGMSRSEGRVHRFRNTDDDDDDEQATWNGNSTQQM